jgi:hypothetical protein
VTEEGNGVGFALGGESYVVETCGRVTASLFGGETEEARAIPPPSGRIGKTLAALFPMPLLCYGYHYV